MAARKKADIGKVDLRKAPAAKTAQVEMTTTSVVLPRDMVLQLKKLALEQATARLEKGEQGQRVSVSDVVRDILGEYLRKRQ